MKAYAKVVYVDFHERRNIPKSASAALSAVGGSYPQLVFMSPNGETKYGSFNHASMRNQDYSKIFRDLKKKIREAKKTGELADLGATAKVDTEDVDAVSEDVDSDAVVIQAPRVRTWKSSKGREIKAKLIKFENGIYQLKTTKGKVISVTVADLDEKSVALADEIVSINKK